MLFCVLNLKAPVPELWHVAPAPVRGDRDCAHDPLLASCGIRAGCAQSELTGARRGLHHGSDSDHPGPLRAPRGRGYRHGDYGHMIRLGVAS